MQDEIVPKEHMRALWEAVARRGEKASVGSSGSGSGGRNPGSSSSSASVSVGEADDSQTRWRKGTERAKYMEFENGGHSKLVSFFHVYRNRTKTLCTDDTCVQQGYWAAIIEFVNSLGEMKGLKHRANTNRRREKTKSPPRAPDSARNPYSSSAAMTARRHLAMGDQAPSPF
jgi:hypothetical protein